MNIVEASRKVEGGGAAAGAIDSARAFSALEIERVRELASTLMQSTLAAATPILGEYLRRGSTKVSLNQGWGALQIAAPACRAAVACDKCHRLIYDNERRVSCEPAFTTSGMRKLSGLCTGCHAGLTAVTGHSSNSAVAYIEHASYMDYRRHQNDGAESSDDDYTSVGQQTAACESPSEAASDVGPDAGNGDANSICSNESDGDQDDAQSSEESDDNAGSANESGTESGSGDEPEKSGSSSDNDSEDSEAAANIGPESDTICTYGECICDLLTVPCIACGFDNCSAVDKFAVSSNEIYMCSNPETQCAMQIHGVEVQTGPNTPLVAMTLTHSAHIFSTERAHHSSVLGLLEFGAGSKYLASSGVKVATAVEKGVARIFERQKKRNLAETSLNEPAAKRHKGGPEQQDGALAAALENKVADLQEQLVSAQAALATTEEGNSGGL